MDDGRILVCEQSLVVNAEIVDINGVLAEKALFVL